MSRVSLSRLYKRELRIFLPYRWPASFGVPPFVYLYQHHTYVPYEVVRWNVVGKVIILSAADFDLLGRFGEERKGYDIFLEWGWLREALKKGFTLEMLVFCEGFSVVSHEGHQLGVVQSVEPHSVQSSLIVEGKKGIVDIPIDPKFIRDVDIDGACVRVCWEFV